MEQGTLPVLGSGKELPALQQPHGHSRERECSGMVELCPPGCTARPWAAFHPQGLCGGSSGAPGSPPGPACPAPATLGPSQAGDGGRVLGSLQEAGKSLVALVPTQLQPCATNPFSQQGLGEVFPLFFPIFPVSHKWICDPVAALGSPQIPLAHVGCAGGAQALPQPLWLWEGFPRLGQILGSQEQSAARHPLIFAFSKIKTGKHLVPTPWTLPCPRELGSSWGSHASPAFTLCKIRAMLYLFLSLRKEQSFICRCGGALFTSRVIPFFFFFCGEIEV